MSKWSIKDIVIDNPVVIAPMAGITNLSFRQICKEFGAGLIYSEMISDRALNYQNEKTLKMAEVLESEHPVTIQLVGGEIDTMVEAAKFIDKNSNCDIIDINMGCPVRKIQRSNAGSALLKDIDYAARLVKDIVDNVNKPVTVKFRAGLTQDKIIAKELAILLEQAGASGLAIHGRTANQMYSGTANWDIITQVKNSVSIPVMGNGDVKSVEDALRMKRETNCDGVMIGRGIFGNPWLVKEIVSAFDNNEISLNITPRDIHQHILKHLDSMVALKGEHIGLLEMRPHICWYLSGLKNNTKMKQIVNQTNSIKEMKGYLDLYFKAIDSDDFKLIIQ